MKSIKTIILLLNLFIALAAQSLTIDYQSGWNLVGLPVEVEDPYYLSIFPDAIENTLYSFDITYNPASMLVPGDGYWLMFQEEGTATMVGTLINELTINLDAGWNFISGIADTVSIYSVIDLDSIITPGTLYGFDITYNPDSMLVPGKGYWLRAYQEGEITFEEISFGAPYYIEPEYDPNSTTATGGGFYQTQCAAIVYDRWYNPVEDSTYVYWTIEPTPPDTSINAFVDGVSFTGNENLDGGSYSGMAFSTIVYSTDAIGDIAYVSATTYGANGDTITARINEDEGETLLFFLPGQLTLTASAYYWDFTLPTATDEVEIQITAMLIDFYGNAVSEAPIAFNGVGVSEWREIGYENYTDGGGGFEADGCFSWRDYGLDDDPGTLDEGEGNDDHDGFDLDGDGVIDTSEVSEPFDDFGLDGLPDTNDEGEGNGEWEGYHMIDCGPTVRTDQDGIARITAVFPKELCIWLSVDAVTPFYNHYQEFGASITGALLIPQQITSDPITIQLVRSPTIEGP